MLSKEGLEQLKEISIREGLESANSLSLDFLKMIIERDRRNLTEKEKINDLKKNVMRFNGEYYILVKYGMKPNKTLEKLYNLASNYSLDVNLVIELFEKRDEFNLTSKEMVDFLEKKFEEISFDNYKKNNNTIVNIKDSLIKEYNLKTKYKYNLHMLKY